MVQAKTTTTKKYKTSSAAATLATSSTTSSAGAVEWTTSPRKSSTSSSSLISPTHTAATASTPSPSKSEEQRRRQVYDDDDEAEQERQRKLKANNPHRGCSRGCKCCCIFVFLLAVFAVIAGGVVIWWFLQQHADLLPPLNAAGDVTLSPTASPAPTFAPWNPTTMECSRASIRAGACCLGLDEPGICDLRANHAAYAYVHNAMHTVADGFRFPWNHERNLEEALRAGYRALELDVGRCASSSTTTTTTDSSTNTDIVFYHSRCELGSRSVSSVMTAVDEFLELYPTELVWLFFQMPLADSGGKVSVSVTEMSELIETQHPEIANRLYSHRVGSPWPTIGNLLAIDKRIILVYWNQPSCRRTDEGCPEGWIPYYDVGVETSFQFRTLRDIWNDESQTTEPTACTLRSAGLTGGGARDLWRANAFLTLPSARAQMILNNPRVVQSRFDTCHQLSDDDRLGAVNFYAVDFWAAGNVPRAIWNINRQRAAALFAQQQREQQEAAAAAAQAAPTSNPQSIEQESILEEEDDPVVANNGTDGASRRRRRLRRLGTPAAAPTLNQNLSN